MGQQRSGGREIWRNGSRFRAARRSSCRFLGENADVVVTMSTEISVVRRGRFLFIVYLKRLMLCLNMCISAAASSCGVPKPPIVQLTWSRVVIGVVGSIGQL